MKKHLFIIYTIVLEVNVVLLLVCKYFGKDILGKYYNSFMDINSIVLIVFLELYVIASFFVDELIVKRKIMVIVLFINMLILSETYWRPMIFILLDR
ncbi:MAG: hypothetical protein RBT87_07045 [bacterium]|nr:hypothetical protein [bacterium]